MGAMDTILVAYHLICFTLVISAGHVLRDEDGAVIPNLYELESSLVDDAPADVIPQLSDDERIVGGRVAAPHSRPWQVLLYSSNHILCGGTVIHPLWVLTAAHCIPEGYGVNVSISAVAGTNQRCIEPLPGRRQTKYGDGAEIRKVVHIRINGFNKVSLKYDIALYKMDSPFPMNQNIKAIPMATSEPPESETLEVSGWGRTRELGISSCVLLTASLPKIRDSTCKLIYGTDSTQFCAGYLAGGIDPCQGDSGGPLVRLNGTSAVLYGIVSYGRGCAQPYRPTVYTKVSAFYRWIVETIRRY